MFVHEPDPVLLDDRYVLFSETRRFCSGRLEGEGHGVKEKVAVSWGGQSEGDGGLGGPLRSTISAYTDDGE